MERIPFCSPAVSEQDIRYVAESVSHCSDDRVGDYQHQFESKFVQYLGVRYAHAVSSRSVAMHVALAALTLKPGDEVIVPDVAPLSLLMPLKFLEAVPVFVDVHPETWCLSTESFRKSITPRTRAVLALELYGNIPEMHRIRAISKAREIAVIEDASDALGGEFLGRRVGSLGDLSIFGFDRAETLTSAEGGMVATDSPDLAAAIQKTLLDSSFDNHISPMQAALGASQLDRLAALAARKCEISERYQRQLQTIPGVRFSVSSPGSKTIPCETAIAVDDAEYVMEQLSNLGIECRLMPQPASSYAVYDRLPQARVARGRNRTSYAVSRMVLSLPSGTNLSDAEIDKVCRAVAHVTSQTVSVAPRFFKAA